MKKVKLIDEISNIDDKYINKALRIDSKEKLVNEGMKMEIMKFNNLFKWGAVCLGCICLVFVGVIAFNNKKPDNNTDVYNKPDELMQIVNPLTEVSSVEEMKKYLGFDVPVIEGKEVSTYIVIGEGKVATHGRIMYKDKSSFEIEKGTNKDVSGIEGGSLKKKETINNIEVSIYKMEDIVYANWSDSTYSYSYSMENVKVDKLIKELKSFIK